MGSEILKHRRRFQPVRVLYITHSVPRHGQNCNAGWLLTTPECQMASNGSWVLIIIKAVPLRMVQVRWNWDQVAGENVPPTWLIIKTFDCTHASCNCLKLAALQSNQKLATLPLCLTIESRHLSRHQAMALIFTGHNDGGNPVRKPKVSLCHMQNKKKI